MAIPHGALCGSQQIEKNNVFKLSSQTLTFSSSDSSSSESSSQRLLKILKLKMHLHLHQSVKKIMLFVHHLTC